jgi:hypothetical protein
MAAMDNTNAERQRRYIQRLKERAAGVTNAPAAAASAKLQARCTDLERQLADAKARIAQLEQHTPSPPEPDAAEIEQRVREEVASRVDRERLRYQEAHAQAEMIIAKHRILHGIFEAKDYRAILACLHPDNSASEAKRAKAFDLVKAAEPTLAKPEPKPRGPDLPKAADLAARKAWATVERKRKRAEAKTRKTARKLAHP